MLAQLFSVFVFCSMALAAFGLGRPILRGLGGEGADRLSAIVFSIAIGWIAAGTLLLGLGLLGGLYAPLIGVTTMAASFWGLGEVYRRWVQLAEQKAFPSLETPCHRDDVPPQAPWAPPPGWLFAGVLLAAGAACLGSLVGALAPPTAGDAMCYHLQLPKTFLAEHRIVYLPYHDNSTFPLLTEMWFLWGLALDGGIAAQLVHWGMGILLGLATVVLATPVVGRRWGWIAGGLVVLTPGINNQMSAPLNDVALAAFTTLALAAWWRAAVEEQGRRWYVLAGIAAGGALGTKYIALVFAAAVAAVWGWAAVRRRGRRRAFVKGAAVVAVVAVSLGGPWYLRAAWHRGNPVFPFLTEVFEGSDPAAGGLETLPESKSPLGRGPLGLAVGPWLLTMHPERFGGRGHQLGALWVAALPGLLLCRRLRRLGTLLAVASVYFVLWYLLRQNVRFLFPLVPPFSVAAIWVWIELRRFPPAPRRTAAAAFAGIVAAMAVVGLGRARGKWAVAAGWEDREAYLIEREPTYPAAAVANALLEPQDHVLSQDYRAFYFDCRVTRENVYRRCTHYDRRIVRPAQLSRRLRAAGFTHLLLAETVAREGIRYDPTLRRLADAQLAGESADQLLTLTEYLYHDADGAIRRYRLVMLATDREQ